jgi:hypothetical protein
VEENQLASGGGSAGEWRRGQLASGGGQLASGGGSAGEWRRVSWRVEDLKDGFLTDLLITRSISFPFSSI